MIEDEKEGIKIFQGEEFRGMGNYECVKRLKGKFGSQHATITVGPAGERGFLNSSVAVSDMDGIPTRQAARGGLGALLASKGVKAMIIDDSGTKMIQPRNSKVFKKACKVFTQYLLEKFVPRPLVNAIFHVCDINRLALCNKLRFANVRTIKWINSMNR